MTYRYTPVRLNFGLQKSNFCVFAKHCYSKNSGLLQNFLKFNYTPESGI